MALDIVDAVPEVAEALGQVYLQQVSQQVFQVRAEVRGEANLPKTRGTPEGNGGQRSGGQPVKKRFVVGLEAVAFSAPLTRYCKLHNCSSKYNYVTLCW